MGVGDEGYYGIGKRTGLRGTEGAEDKSERKSREVGWPERFMRTSFGLEIGDRVPSLPSAAGCPRANLLSSNKSAPSLVNEGICGSLRSNSSKLFITVVASRFLHSPQ